MLVTSLFLALACGEREEAPAGPSPDPGPALPVDPEPTPPEPEPTPEPAPDPEPVPEPAPPEPTPDPMPEPEPAPEPEPTPEPTPAPPAISLDELADRIKETRAIGVFTKLALKNDIDDLVGALGAHHERGEGRLADLQQRYEALVLKLLTLLEPEEPDLALALARSREEIWNRLADPVRFAEINT